MNFFGKDNNSVSKLLKEEKYFTAKQIAQRKKIEGLFQRHLEKMEAVKLAVNFLLWVSADPTSEYCCE